MEKNTLGILIMAAGKGTRMKSGLPKVLHPILDTPILEYLLKSVISSVTADIAVLVGSGGEQVCSYLEKFPSVKVLWQKEQLGTGHAVQTAQSWWKQFKTLLVLNGDLPLLKPQTLNTFLKEHEESEAKCSILTFQTENPGSYGRIIRHEGHVSIVEFKDATEEERLIREVNAGCYVFDVQSLSGVIGSLHNNNSQGEYYLPEVVSLLSEKGAEIRAIEAPEDEMAGVNTQAELSSLSLALRDRLISYWMEQGVRVMDPSSVWIGADVQLAQDVCLYPDVQLWGSSSVGEGSEIGSGCILRNAKLGKNVCLNPYVVIENSSLDDGAKAGPFAYIRESSQLEKKAFVGKFVEIKKTRVGHDSKVPHLTYLGDTTLGADVNIGAGCITCNYDGKAKHPTEIGDRCFVGSDTIMVAPVKLGDDSMTAAGSVITNNVPEGALGVGRARQRNIEGWSLRHNLDKQGG